MVKKSKWKYYGVRRIAGVRTEPDGEVRFLVKWIGYSNLHDTWEPFDNLRNVKEMVTEFLLKNGLSLGLISGEVEQEKEQVTEQPAILPAVPQNIKVDSNIPIRKVEFLTFQAGELREEGQTSPEQVRSFPSIKLQPGCLDRDRPVKIIGARGSDRNMEYAVLFAPSPDRFVGVGVVSHHEIVTRAPWLFARFFLSSESVTLPTL